MTIIAKAVQLKLLILPILLVSNLSTAQGTIGAETRNLSSVKINLDLKKFASEKVYFSQYASYQSMDSQIPRFSSYVISQTMINLKLNKKITFSNGYQYFKDYTYDFKQSAWVMKLDFKLYE